MALGDDYITSEEFKDYIRLEGETEFDGRIDDAITSASREIERHCGRVFNQTTTATSRTYQVMRQRLVLVDDFHTTDDLLIESDGADDGSFGTTWASDSYQLEPLDGVLNGIEGWPYWRIRAVGGGTFPWRNRRASLRVTAQWGWGEVPAPVKQACFILAAENFKLASAPLGVAGFSEFGVVRVVDNKKAASKLAQFKRDFHKVR